MKRKIITTCINKDIYFFPNNTISDFLGKKSYSSVYEKYNDFDALMKKMILWSRRFGIELASHDEGGTGIYRIKDDSGACYLKDFGDSCEFEWRPVERHDG
jgi:hypothetical protein